MTASCALHNSQTGNQELGSAFGARWSADREQVELKLNTDLLDPAPVRLELTGGITIPEAGIVNPINVTMVADLSSQERPKCCAKGDPPACCPWRFLDPASVGLPTVRAVAEGCGCRLRAAVGIRMSSARL